MRTNVSLALTRAIQKLKTMRQVPANGIAIFSGQTDSGFILQTIEPPKPIKTRRYRCSSEFYLEPLNAMIADTELTGVLAVDATECGIGVIDTNGWRCIENVTSGVQGKSGKGGSSARRYERNREAELVQYFSRAAEHVKHDLLERFEVKNIIVSGPAWTKREFAEHLDYRLKAKISEFVDCEYAGPDGISQVWNRSK